MKTASGFRGIRSSVLGAMVALTAIAFAAPGSAWAQASANPIKLAVSAIGRPPIFSNTFVDVGEAMGFFKAAGVDVTFRWFQRGRCANAGAAPVRAAANLGQPANRHDVRHACH